VIGWRQSHKIRREKKTGWNSNLVPWNSDLAKFGANLSFNPVEAQCTLRFRNLTCFITKQGIDIGTVFSLLCRYLYCIKIVWYKQSASFLVNVNIWPCLEGFLKAMCLCSATTGRLCKYIEWKERECWVKYTELGKPVVKRERDLLNIGPVLKPTPAWNWRNPDDLVIYKSSTLTY
jgi:hypothetical protein